MRLLVTRPEPDATRTASALTALGHQVTVAPLLTMRTLPDARLPKRVFQGLIITSANGVRALKDHRERDQVAELPVYTVGDATALAARRAGFATVTSAGGDVAELTAHLAAILKPDAGPLLHLAGDVVASDPTNRLLGAGFQVHTTALYAMDPVETLPMGVNTALVGDGLDGVLLYSRRTAAIFALTLRRADLAPLDPQVHCYCLSQAVADAVRPVCAGPVHVADTPTQISLFACLNAERDGKTDPQSP
ncbi:MAG: uroporphyrinogen-III synthase [Alphaproteobacteria bacterium]